MNKVIGILIIFGLLCYSIYSGSKQYWPVFFDIPSFIIVTGLTFGFMVATVSKGGWSVLCRFIFGETAYSEANPKGLKPIQIQALCQFLLGGSRAALISGFIGTITGLVIMLMNMDDPSAIGPAMAVAIITLLYGGILSEFVFMLMYRIAVNRYWFDNEAESDSIPQTSRNTMWMYCGCGMGLVLVCFLAIMISFCEIKKDSPESQSNVTSSAKSKIVPLADSFRSTYGAK